MEQYVDVETSKSFLGRSIIIVIKKKKTSIDFLTNGEKKIDYRYPCFSVILSLHYVHCQILIVYNAFAGLFYVSIVN